MAGEGYSVAVIKPGVLVRDRFGNILDARSTVTLVKGNGLNTIIDTGLSSERQVLINALSEQNLAPNDINILINTHSHPDHTGNNELFENAKLVTHRRELYGSDETRDILLIENDTEVEPGILVFETPGHTRGSISVLVNCTNIGSELTRCIMTGDALPIRDNYLKWVPPGIHFDSEIALQSMQKIIGLSDIIIPGHDKPFKILKGRIRQAKYIIFK